MRELASHGNRMHLRDAPAFVVTFRSGGKPCTARLPRCSPSPAHVIWVANAAPPRSEHVLDVLAPDAPVTTCPRLYNGLSRRGKLACTDIFPFCAVEDPMIAGARQGITVNARAEATADEPAAAPYRQHRQHLLRAVGAHVAVRVRAEITVHDFQHQLCHD